MSRGALATHADVIRAIEPAVEQGLRLLPSVEDAWQATDCLPDLASADWREQLDVFRRDAAALPDDLLVVLVGDMVTEEALPSYSMALNELVRDAEGTGQTPWARWLRG